VKNNRPTYRELERRLAAAEPIVEALKHHEVDAIVGEKKIAFLLLKKVTETLMTSEAGFSAMFELAGVGMIQADALAFHLTRVNQTFCEMMGYSNAELLSKTYLGLTHPLDRQRDMKGLSRVIRDKADSWSIEKRCVRKDGSVVWVSVHGAVVRDEAGVAVRFIAMITDMTALKQAEQEHRDVERKLENQVQERTAELSRTIQSLRRQVAKRKRVQQVLRDNSSSKKAKPSRKVQ